MTRQNLNPPGKNVMVWVRIVSCLLFCASAGLGQSRIMDALHLKNGNTVIGTVITWDPDSGIRILAEDGIIYRFGTYDIAKLGKIEMRGVSPTDSVALARELEEGRKVCFALSAGLSAPVGEFAASRPGNVGHIRPGIGISLDINRQILGPLDWITSVSYSLNSISTDRTSQNDQMSFEAESWKNLWLLTGLKYVATYNPGEELFFGGQYGVLVGMYPETKVRYAGMYGASARTEEGNTSTNIAGALFCGFRIHYVSFSIRYLIGDFTVRHDPAGGSLLTQNSGSTATS
jgi:hypothetical protein